MMRILIVADRPERRRYWDEVVPLLHQEQVEAFLVTPGEPGSLHLQWRELGCRSFALGSRRAEGYGIGAARLARLVRHLEIDVIHSIESTPAAVGGLGGILARRGLRVFSRQHLDFGGDRKRNLISRIASHLNEVTLACSFAAAEAANSLDHVPRDRIRVAHNGANRMRHVSDQEIAATRSQLGIPDEARVVSAVSRLRPEKGLSALIAAYPHAAGALSPVELHLVIAGDGSEESILRRQAVETAPRNIHFVGYQEDVAPWFAAADVVAMPSAREAFGIAGAEAMACGRPLVACAVGGLTELVEDGVTGTLVEQGSVTALAHGLSQVLLDPELTRAMGEAARRRFESHFTNEAMVRGWLDSYCDFLTPTTSR